MKIVVQPGLVLDVTAEETLLQVLVRYQIAIDNVCNGAGTCGKCKVRFPALVSEPSEIDYKHLTALELKAGFRLACTVKPVDDMEVIVRAADTFDRKELVLSNMREKELNTGLQKVYLEIEKPSLADERGDWDRTKDKLREKLGREVNANLNVLRQLPEILRDSDFALTVTIWHDQVLAVERGDTTPNLFGIALDIGTTSVAAALMDLNTGSILKVASKENGQIAFGLDVISRITFAMESRAQGEQLKRTIIETVNDLVFRVSSDSGVNQTDIYKMTVVANTTMHHLFLGMDVSNLAVLPFVSSCNSALDLPAAELGIDINPAGRILMFPNIGSFVGGDTLGAIIGQQEVLQQGNHLLIDLGTNCELFLKTETTMLACSTAAGPAFEGAGIAQGMRAKPGAIEGIEITPEQVDIKIIGNQQPIGICGSGLIKGIHQMRKAEVINRQGILSNPVNSQHLPTFLAARIRAGQNGREFLLATGLAGSTDVVFTQKDIGELQLAKGAVCAGIKTIIKLAGISLSELDSIVLAGTFATYLDAESILGIGLLPNVDQRKIIFAGNSAHRGAVLTLLDEQEFRKAEDLAQRINHVELGGNQTFNQYFMTSMYLEPSN